MLNRRMDGTAQDMIASGQWAKAGRGRYVHASGAEIRKGGARRVASTDPGISWSRLWVGRNRIGNARISILVKRLAAPVLRPAPDAVSLHEFPAHVTVFLAVLARLLD